MKPLLMIISAIVVLGIAGLVLRDLQSRRPNAFGFRNLFLLGFAIFYGIASFFEALWTFNAEIYVPGERGYRNLIAAIPIFLLVFAIFCGVGRRMRWPERVVPRLELPVTFLGLMTATAVLIAAALLTAALSVSGYFSVLATQFKGGFASAAVALATYCVLARRSNPVCWVVFFCTLAPAIVVGTVGESGRRQVLGTLLAAAWIWYYFSLRNRSGSWSVLKLGALAVALLTAIYAYSFVRHRDVGSEERPEYALTTRVGQLTELVTNPNPNVRVRDAFSLFLQDTPVNTMYIIEHYPEIYPYVPFNGAVFLLGNPIPRRLWPGKPEAMGVQVQEQLGIGANLGIGVIGHGWAEGNWIGVLGYAAFFGIFVSVADGLIRNRAWNPYFLAATGSGLGNVLALSRGETSLFLLQVLASFVGCSFVLTLLRWTVGPAMASSAPMLVPGIQPAAAATDESTDNDASDHQLSDGASVDAASVSDCLADGAC